MKRWITEEPSAFKYVLLSSQSRAGAHLSGTGQLSSSSLPWCCPWSGTRGISLAAAATSYLARF